MQVLQRITKYSLQASMQQTPSWHKPQLHDLLVMLAKLGRSLRKRQVHCDGKKLQILRIWEYCLIIGMEEFSCGGIGVCQFVPCSYRRKKSTKFYAKRKWCFGFNVIDMKY